MRRNGHGQDVGQRREAVLCERGGGGGGSDTQNAWHSFISLALILADIDTLSPPPFSITPLPVRTSLDFPAQAAIATHSPLDAPRSQRSVAPGRTASRAVSRLSFAPEPNIFAPRKPGLEGETGVPPLVALCVHKHVVSWSPHKTEEALRGVTISPHLTSRLMCDRPCYAAPRPQDKISQDSSPSDLHQPAVPTRTLAGVEIYLTGATLLVVPSLLMNQWRAEIGKHLEPGAVRVVTVGPSVAEAGATTNSTLMPDLGTMLAADVSRPARSR